jgi:hypothetical protein
LHAPPFRLTGVERGSKPVADRQRLFWLLTSAAPTTPNTSIDARDGIGNRPTTSCAAAVRSCPVMAITRICEPALAAIT